MRKSLLFSRNVIVYMYTECERMTLMAMQRLDKLIASTGKYSRREVKLLIKEGRVLVDGVPSGSAGDKVDPEVSAVEVDGVDIGYREFTYIMLHKPAGVLTATEDKRQKTVLDLLSAELRRRELSPVGRLDKDTEGLLLLTNDGELNHRLLSPKSHVDKVYYAELDAPLGEADVQAFADGITLADGTKCMSAGLTLLGDGKKALITLREGKFHQVKRMTASRGAAVLYLKRLSMGALRLDESLERGEYRFLTDVEIRSIGGKC